MPYDLRTPQQRTLVLANARIVLETETLTGSLALQDGRIAAVDPGAGVPPGAEDCGGDYLAPGLIELHTDNLERHLEPRPGVRWPDARPSSPTTPSSPAPASPLSSTRSASARWSPAARPATASTPARSPPRSTACTPPARCASATAYTCAAETCSETLVEELAEFAASDRVGILSLMDHTPGQRQFTDISKLRDYAASRRDMNEAEFQAHVARLRDLRARNGARHEAAAVAGARRLGAKLTSHNDATSAQVAASAGHGARIAEFPMGRNRGENVSGRP